MTNKILRDGERVILKPINGLNVPNFGKASQYLSQDGEKITINKYWRNRIADGDVEVIELSAPVQSKTNKESKEDK